MSYNNKPDLKLLGITEQFLAELHILLREAFVLYSSYEKNTNGEFVMSYDELQSFYLSFKEEFKEEIHALNEKRAQKQVENFNKVEHILIETNGGSWIFSLENNMDGTNLVRYVMRHQEDLPQEDLPQEDLPQEVITEANFILGFERLIFRIYHEIRDNYVMNITERFKQWLIEKIGIKNKEREIQEQIRKTQSEKEDVEREIQHIKEMAEKLGYYYALKAYSEGPIYLSELIYAENLHTYEKPIEIFLKPSDFDQFVKDYLEFDKDFPHRLRKQYVISEKAESNKIRRYREVVGKATTAHDKDLVEFEINLRKDHFTICFNIQGEYKIGISPDSLYHIIHELLQFYKDYYEVNHYSVHDIIKYLYNKVFTTENTDVINRRIAERYEALLTAVREKNVAEARKQQEEREEIRKKYWWEQIGGRRKKTFRKNKPLKKSGKTKRSKKNRKTNKKK